MSAIDLYYAPISSPCRAVMLTVGVLGLKVNMKRLNLLKKEHMAPDFVKMNPQHSVPTIVDGDFVLCESKAIICYLADRYGKDESLYPKDLKKRAVVNHRLSFEACTLYQRFLDYYIPFLYHGASLDPAKRKRLEDAFAMLESYLDGQTWVAGAHQTIADFPLVATVSTAEIFGFDIAHYPNVSRWLANAKKSIPKYDEMNHSGCLEYKKIMESKMVIDFDIV